MLPGASRGADGSACMLADLRCSAATLRVRGERRSRIDALIRDAIARHGIRAVIFQATMTAARS